MSAPLGGATVSFDGSYFSTMHFKRQFNLRTAWT
jgi:hypothetical protein